MATTASAARTLFVGSGKGTIKSYEFDETATDKVFIKEIFSTSDSSPAPTWQTIFGNLLYSVSETEGTEGVVTAYQIGSDKKLIKKGSAKGLAGPVSIAVGKGGKLVVSAAYGAGGVNTFAADGSGGLTTSQTFKYENAKPGAVPDRQKEPHPHQALMDPTGKFVIVPDLGSDKVRVFSPNSSTTIKETNVIDTPAGFGPRHAVFYPLGNGNATHLFVVGELSNNIITFKLTYEGDQMKGENVATMSTFGTQPVPSGSPAPAAGEIALSPDGKYLYVSNRLDKTQAGNTQDSIAAFCIDNGAKLTFMQLSASGGQSPRHFSITKDGNWVAIANSGNGNFGIFKRYPGNGTLASLPIISMANEGAACAMWYEP
ncbi:putative isomerase YbhE [Choiromyces venosus 120613-1]|uniref:Putative isomerase YbhE n=1 Tax=Choiromyces venosus 120613-1 TaxID=1336337 RepID=A0A3N4IVX2_9PEZI|nr:putative isomerase YbhE [Choiromyces venosus 120613-1]